VCFEIFLDNLKDTKKKIKDQKKQYTISDFQKSERDFAFMVDKHTKAQDINVTIQSSEKTLTDEDLEKLNQKIISTVEAKSGAKIRS